MANDNNETQEQQGIQFEDIQPWYDNSGDTGLSARLKLKRNFDKIKAFLDAISSLPSLIRNYLSRVNDDTAEGEITFKKGLKVGTFRSRFLGSGAAIDPAGNAEFESIYSRSFISAPEFVFNRIKVTEGEIWCTNGYGDIEDVKEGEDENGDAVANGGLITLHLDENDYASVQVGDICRGIYNDIAGAYETATVDDDVQMAAGSSSQEGDGIGFSAKRGFFTSYFYIERMVINRKGECQFIYKLRSATTPHPCVFMKFAQYGSFTNAERRASKYESSINHYYKMILEGVSTWQIQSANIVSRSGYLGDMEVELADHTTRQLQGYGLYVQNNVYFGSAVVQLDPYTLEMLERDLAQYDVNLGEHVDMIVVDDTGNVIGGVYTETTEGGVTTREYRIHSAITVRKKNVLLTEALADAEAGTGTYKIGFTPVGCTAMIENSTLYITGIDYVKDGVAGSGDDTNFDYDAMRAVDSCRVDLVIDCEGVTSVQKSIPIVVKHDSQPYVGADISNQFSGVSWNTKTQQYAGLPIEFNFKMWHNDEVLDIVSANDISVTLADGSAIPDTWTYDKAIMTVSGNKIAYISISELPADLGSVTDLRVTCSAVYSGVRYERTLVHTINKSTDTNVYSLIPSVDEVIVNKNTGVLSSVSVGISVVCDSSDNKHYAVAYNQFGTHQLCICYKKFYTDGTSDANETEYTGDAVSVNSGVERVSFFLYKKVGTTIDRTVLHDKEDVPVIANGQDGKGIEYIFITKADWDGTDADKPSIEEEDTTTQEFQRDNHCPYTDSEHTAQWTDEPTGVAYNAKFEFYAQRKKVNGVWQPFGEVKLWNRYVVDGVTPYVIDLSNEQSMVACNESGTVVGSYETSKLMLFYGQSYAFNDFAITITPTNITCNNSAVAFTLTAEQKAAAQTAGYFTLTPSEIKEDSATIAVTATKGNIVLNAVYKVNKAYAGKNGVIYSLITSLDTIRRGNNGSLADSTVDIQVKKTVGASATILSTLADMTTDGLTLKYENATTQSAQTISESASIATSTLVGSSGAGTWGKILLVKNNIIVDQERINVVSDGCALTSTNIYYTAATTAPTTPTGAPSLNTSWVDDGNTLIINSNASKHLYESTCTTYSNGTYSWSTPVDDGLIQDMAGTAEEYALADNNSTAPTTGWSSTVTPTKGKWVWSRTVLTFSDSSTTAINTQCVGYCGYNGDDGYGIVLTITRDNYTEANWSAIAAVGGSESFSYSGGVTVRAGDYFIVKGTSTDKGLMHTATFECTSQTSSIIYGDCISHICDGEKGDPGDDGSYYVKEYAVGDSRTTAPTSGWGATQPSPSDGQYVWERSRLYNPNTGTYGSYVYVCLTGLKGATGNTGPMYYPAGIYASNKTYTVTEKLVPVVEYSGSYYYAKKTVPADHEYYPTNTEYWSAFSNFAAAFVEVLFASFAKLGSFVISGDWFISQYGTVNGYNSANYQAFNGVFTDQTTNFIPYLAMDAKNGSLFCQKGTIGGFEIGATSLGRSSLATGATGYTYITPDGKIKLWKSTSASDKTVIDAYGAVAMSASGANETISISAGSGAKIKLYVDNGSKLVIDTPNNLRRTPSEVGEVYIDSNGFLKVKLS